MPIRVRNAVTVGGDTHQSPFVGPVDHTVSIAVPIGVLTADEVDANGYLKPGLPLTAAGARIGVGGAVYGCVVEATKVATGNDAAALTAAGSPQVTVALIGTVNRDVLEDNLGRVLTADEVAGFSAAGSLIKLLD